MKNALEHLKTEAGHVHAGYGFGGVIGLLLLVLLLVWIF
jgi:hypothetical protein